MAQANFATHLLTGVQEYILRARQSIPGRDAIFPFVPEERELGGAARENC